MARRTTASSYLRWGSVQKEMNNFFVSIRAIYGPQIEGTASLLSYDVTTLFMVKFQILKRWAKHFISIIKPLFKISDIANVWLPKVERNDDLDLSRLSEKQSELYGSSPVGSAIIRRNPS
ncbi:unnamed protein product [Schistocephalus solidus]|uniref:CRAL-TRIO domain-containing protein n=1 Tax=Schistocephalus solidus TaxID=70667 RepID=A0A183T2S6_SCHSO|nr:unnamed protein product [Schistocephalus solidus]